MTAPVCPVLHRFEVDPASGRIVGLRFRMTDGSDVVVGHRVHQVDLEPDEHPADEWRVEERRA